MKIKKTSLEEFEYDPKEKQGYISMSLDTDKKKFIVYVVTGPYNSLEKHFNGKFQVCFYELNGNETKAAYISYDQSVFNQIYNIAKGIGQKMMKTQTPDVVIN